jgi:hypothetical protein
MEPLTAAMAVKETLSATTLKEAGLQLSKSEVAKLAPVQIADTPFLQVNALVENVPLGERHASFLSASEFKQLEFIKRPDIEGIQIRLGGQEINLSLKEGDYLQALGVKSIVSYALAPSLDLFTKIRLQELSGYKETTIAERLGKSLILLPTPLAFAVNIADAGRFLTELESTSKTLEGMSKPCWFQARRIDYLVGEQYIPGRVCNLPIVGGISNWVFKSHLDLDMQGTDWAKLGSDVVMVVSVVAIPLAPATGGLAMVGWVAANAGFGAVSQGAISYLGDQDLDHALKSAGKGALLGSVGGLAGVAAVAKVAPAISNKLLATAASGVTVGSATAATSSTIRVIEKGEDFPTAAKEVALETIFGGLAGGAIGAAGYGLSQIATKLSPATIAPSEVSIAKKAGDFEKWQKQVEPVLRTDRNLHMGDVRNYSKQLDANLDGFAAHLKTTNPQFAEHVNRMAQKYSDAVAAKDISAIAKLETQMKRNLAGEFSEALGVAKFSPFFDKFSLQKRVQDGATIVDAVFEGAKQPLAIKGHGLVEKGGSLPIEFKAGPESYFKNEIASGHLLKQVGGHADFGKGLVVTTRDVSDAYMNSGAVSGASDAYPTSGGARALLKEAGSAPWRLLPYKDEIDAAVAGLVRGERA